MSDELRDMPETIYPVTARQQAMYDATEGVAELFGKFDQGSGPDGAHYVAESPFDGLACSSCLFYEGARACEVVGGDIAPEGVCKLWIIPEALVPGSTSEGTDPAAQAALSTEGEQMREQLAATEIGRRAIDHEREHRAFASVELDEVRETAGALTFRGYASVFNAPYDVAGLFTEEVAPTAFNRTLSHDRQIHLLHGHEGLALASTAGGTLRLSTDSHGLAVEADLDPASPWAQSVASAVRRGDVGEMSFGFYVKADSWSDDMTHRRLDEVQLDEVSIVRRGANPATAGEMAPDKIEQDAAPAPADPTPARDIAGALDVRLRFAAIDDV
jgi:hypothetical protein